jgi:hypothetical protein
MDQPTEVFRLAEAHEQWKYESKRYGPRSLVATPSSRSRGFIYSVIPRKQIASLFKRTPWFHEAIFPNEPCRLFLDVELKGGEDVVARGTVRLVQILAQVSDMLTALGCTHTPDDEPLVFVGSRPNKFSVHVTYPTRWFKSPAHVLSFIQPLDSIVDRAPAKRAISFLRMPYALRSELQSEGYHKVVLGSELVEQHGAKFSPALWFKGCVSVGMCDPPPADTFIPIPDPPEDLPPPPPVEADLGGKRVHIEKGIGAVLRYLGVTTDVDVEIKAADTWKVFVPPTLFCGHHYETHGRCVHKRNEMLVRMFRNVEGKLKVSTTCMDDECGKWSQVYEEDFTRLYVSAILKSMYEARAAEEVVVASPPDHNRSSSSSSTMCSPSHDKDIRILKRARLDRGGKRPLEETVQIVEADWSRDSFLRS